MILVEKGVYIKPERSLDRAKELLETAKEKGWTEEEFYWAVQLVQTLFVTQ